MVISEVNIVAKGGGISRDGHCGVFDAYIQNTRNDNGDMTA